MNRNILSQFAALVCLLTTLVASGFAQPSSPTSSPAPTYNGASDIPLVSRVDPGAELIGIMLWVSGKYPQPIDSAYKSAVWAHFGKYRNHPSLDRLKRLKVYTDFTEIGLLLSGFPNVKVTLPETMSWYDISTREGVQAVLADAVTFARVSGYWKFYQRHAADYKGWSDAFDKSLTARSVLPTLDQFFRYGTSRNRPQVTILMEPLNGWGAHAIDFARLQGQPNGNRVTFQIGPSSMGETLPDSPAVFQANDYTVGTLWHEGTHIYLRPLLDRSQAQIVPLERRFNAPALASQNIKTWSYAFEENLVRAIAAALIKEKLGEDAYQRELRSQTQRGFIYTPEIADLITSKYVSSPERYPDFDAFFPEIISLLTSTHDSSAAKP